MLKLNKKDKRTNLEKEIDKVLAQIDNLRCCDEIQFDTVEREDGVNHYVDERYTQLVNELEALYKMRDVEKKNELNPNTILTVGGSVLTVLGILIFEKTDILTTKALQFVLRGRV